MSDLRNILQKLFAENDRYPNFGNVLKRIRSKGFRCHSDTILDIESPITALCGLNGTGKSTLLQLAACAYKFPTDNRRSFHIKDFMVVGILDERPFTDQAEVEYSYWQEDRTLSLARLYRDVGSYRWRGYQYRPERLVYFAGIGIYLPKIEEQDFIIRNANKLKFSQATSATPRVKSWVCKILGQSYDNIFLNEVKIGNDESGNSLRTGTVASVERANAKYTEAHMGFGEGRIQHLVRKLELLPEKSLVILEEPETSLHPSAQYALGEYLVDVSKNRHHQILLTTHSDFLLEALPSQSRIYLYRDSHGAIRSIVGLTSQQARSLMADGHVKALHILVEDELAKTIITEILRRTDKQLLRTIAIHVPEKNGSTLLSQTIRTLREADLPVAAVLDGDKAATPKNNIFKLPGTQPPEKEIFASVGVEAYLNQQYGVNMADFRANLYVVDHHEWLTRLADRVNLDENILAGELARVYVGTLNESDIDTLVTELREVARK